MKPARPVPEFSVYGELVAALRSRLGPGANVTLVGMPGAGKSTLARRLAADLGLAARDSDDEIVKGAGRSIPDIFAASGEDAFRRLESEALEGLSRLRGAVVATGGGAVTRPGNLPLLRKNAVVVWVRRPLADLPVDGRPLSRARPLAELYAEREPLYRAVADLAFSVAGATPA